MINNYYRFLAVKRKTRFIFESEGIQGKIVKIVQFTENEDGEWNLGFGDLKNGQVDDMTVSNNQDVLKVLQTVAQVIYVFFEEYPQSTVIIKPIDERRKKLYNFVFQRHIKAIETNFMVFGILNDEKEIYSSKKIYNSFKIIRKFEL